MPLGGDQINPIFFIKDVIELSTKKLQILGSLGNDNSILYTEQSLTDEQKTQARNNISVKEDVADALLSLEFVKPISDDDGPLTENNETFLVVRNEDIFLPEVSAEDEGNVLKVVDGKWSMGAINAPKNEFILNSSTEGSSKKFKITIDDEGVLTATEIVDNEA